MLRLKEFTDYLKNERRYSQHTITAYTTDIGQFFLFIQRQYELEEEKDVTAPMIRSWIYESSETGTSARSINRKRTSLSSYYKFLLKRGYVEQNPFSLVQSIKTEKRLYRWVPEQDMQMLLERNPFGNDFSGLRDRLILELLYGSGIRLAELITLKKANISVNEGTIKVLGKRNKERLIPLPESTVAAIGIYLEACLAKGYVHSPELLLTDKGKSAYPVFIQRKVKYWLGMAGDVVKAHPHLLRHTYATHLLNNGADIGSIKELLGHSSLAATQVYTHNSIERLKTIYKQAHPKG